MQNFVVELPGLNILEISGEDAASFLQAQLTSDISLLSEFKAQFSSWCNPQGRVIANFLILRLHDAYLLVIPADMLARVHQGLSMYILRSKVIITDKSDTYHCAGLCGSETIDKFTSYINKSSSQNRFVIFDMPVDQGVRSIAIDKTLNNNLLQEISSPAIQTLDELIWHKLDIQAGLPWISSRTTEMVMPQEISLDHLGGLSYNKGCFPGQEIIARMHFRGKQKNKLYVGITDPDMISIPTGMTLYSKPHSEKAGIVLNSVPGIDNIQLLLAVMDSELSKNNQFFLEDGSKIKIQFVIPGNLSESGLNDIGQD